MTSRADSRNLCTRKKTAVILAIVVAPVLAAAQQLLPPPPGAGVDRNSRFEVASVRPVDDASGQIFMRMTPESGLEATMHVGMLLRQALQKPDYQIVGAPGWIDTERYSIRARAPGGAPAAAVMVMLANLLRDRFQLATHLETRELPIFHLIIARSDGRLGPDFKPTPAECQATIAERQAAARRGDPPPPLPPSLFDPKARPCGLSRVDSGVAVGIGRTVAQISSTLSDLVGRTVIDKTGLTGLYDFTLKYAPEPGRYAGPTGPPPGAPPPPIDPNVSSISVALQEQLGLKLDGARGPVEVLVIDRIERPSPD
ncbi:MAG: TIGR03435 family protein [Vicinamibacterales bacterium]